MLRSERELLGLFRLSMDFSSPNRELLAGIAARLVSGDLVDLTEVETAFLADSLFRFGLLSAASSVVATRLRMGHALNVRNTWILEYARFNAYHLAIPPRRGRRLETRAGGDNGSKVLSMLHQTLPYTPVGYTHRTQAILKRTGIEVAPYGRIGYPWILGQLKGTASHHSVDVDGVRYSFHRGTLRSQYELFGNIGLARRGIQELIFLEKPDVVHAASNFTNALPALLAAREFGLPFVYEMRGFWELTAGVGIDGWMDSERYKFQRRMEQLVAKEADLVLVLSEVQKRELCTWGVPEQRVIVAGNGCDAVHGIGDRATSPMLEELKARIGRRHAAAYVGTIASYEGLQLLVKVMAADEELRSKMVVVIVGDGPFLAELKSLAEHLSLSDTVFFLGRLPHAEVAGIYDIADLCVLPRLPEPVCQLVTPLKPLEILAHGKVLLVSDVAAMQEQVSAIGLGRTFTAGSERCLAQALKSILTDLPALKEAFGAARERVVGEFSWDKTARLWDRAIEQAASTPVLPADIGRSVVALFDTQPDHVKEDIPQWRRIARAVAPTGVSHLVLRSDVALLPEELTVLSVEGGVETAKHVSVEPLAAAGSKCEFLLSLPAAKEVQTLYFYVPRTKQVQRAAPALKLLFPSGSDTGMGPPRLHPISIERRDILAVKLNYRHSRPTTLEVTSNYDRPVHFVVSFIPLSDARLAKSYVSFSFSPSIGARFHYTVMASGRSTFVPVPRLSGQYFLEFSPWGPELQTKQNDLGRTAILRTVEREGNYRIELDRSRTNILVVADLNENLLDGSVIWLKTLVSELARSSDLNVYVLTNALSIPNANTACVFAQPNVVKIEVPGLGASQGARMGEEAFRFDRMSGGFDRLVVRGMASARALDHKSIVDRIVLYMAGVITPDNTAEGRILDQTMLGPAARVGGLIFQNEATRQIFSNSVPYFRGATFVIPPAIDADFPELCDPATLLPPRKRCILYSGKLTREYGLMELLEGFDSIRREGIDATLMIFGNKFNGNDPDFGAEFRAKVAALGDSMTWQQSASQEEVIAASRRAALIWGWRHGDFENAHFETSTKMVEAIVVGTPIVLFPSSANEEIVGAGYSGFARTAEDAKASLKRLLLEGAPEFAAIHRAHKATYSAPRCYRSLVSYLAHQRAFRSSSRRAGNVGADLLVASHDFRFFEDIEGLFAGMGISTSRDIWRNHDARYAFGPVPADQGIVFCDWCLGNAVWWSRNAGRNTRLVVRLHLQELSTEFPAQVDFSRVERLVFVSPDVKRKAIRQFSIPDAICEVVPISVNLDRTRVQPVDWAMRRKVLGIVGISPFRKRIDLAIEFLERVSDRVPDTKLIIKGSMPSEYDWMASRPAEVRQYQDIFHRLVELERSGRVEIATYDSEMESFYGRVGWILSTSDFEGCHTAVAEGGVMGCLPLMLDWPGAAEVYDARWVHRSLDELVEFFLAHYDRFDEASRHVASEFERKFGVEVVAEKWKRILFPDCPEVVEGGAADDAPARGCAN